MQLCALRGGRLALGAHVLCVRADPWRAFRTHLLRARRLRRAGDLDEDAARARRLQRLAPALLKVLEARFS